MSSSRAWPKERVWPPSRVRCRRRSFTLRVAPGTRSSRGSTTLRGPMESGVEGATPSTPRTLIGRMPRRNLRRGRRKAFGFGSGAYGVVFLLPYLLFLIAFGAAPVVYALLLSFQGHGSIGLSYTLGAYRFAVNDPEFRGAAKHVIEFALVVSPIFLVVVTFLALVLRACPDRVASAFSLAYFLPAAVSSSVVVLLWLLMLDPSSSPYRSALHVFGWTSIASVVNRGNYLLIFATMFLWSTVGGWLLITHSALKNVSKEIVGAAKIDGWDHSGSRATSTCR